MIAEGDSDIQGIIAKGDNICIPLYIQGMIAKGDNDIHGMIAKGDSDIHGMIAKRDIYQSISDISSPW